MAGVYCFLDVTAVLSSPTGVVNLGAGSAVDEAGITIEPVEDKNMMTIGADGEGMHSLVASKAATVTVRLLKTAPVNQQLMNLYNIQTVSSALHGRNTITISDNARGDTIVLSEVAFKKAPSIEYAKEGGVNEWTFDAVKTSYKLGNGKNSLF